MLAFIFQNPHYQAATKGWQKALIALALIVANLGVKTLGLAMWSTFALVTGLLFSVQYYSATTLAGAIAGKESFYFIFVAFLAILSIILLIGFVTAIIAFLVVLSIEGVSNKFDSRNTPPPIPNISAEKATWRNWIIGWLNFFKTGIVHNNRWKLLGGVLYLTFVLGAFLYAGHERRSNADSAGKYDILPGLVTQIPQQLYDLLPALNDVKFPFHNYLNVSPGYPK